MLFYSEGTSKLKVIGNIIKCARRSNSLTQGDLSRYLQVSQSAISKFESGTLEPSATQWYQLCKIFNISADSIECGYLDRHIKAKLNSDSSIGFFRIPSQYVKNKSITVREMMPAYLLMKEYLNERAFGKHVSELGIDFEYFIDLDNQVNVDFFQDFLAPYMHRGDGEESKIVKLAKYSRVLESHGVLKNVYERERHPLKKLNKYISNQTRYNCNFKNNVVDLGEDSMTIEVEMNNHLRGDKYYCAFFRSYFKHVINEFVNMAKNSNGGYKVSCDVSCKDSESKWDYVVCCV